MIKKFKYKYIKFELLNELLFKGLVGISVNKDENQRPNIVWLILSDHRVVKITSIVSSVDDWDEMGSLVFELTKEGFTPHPIIPLNNGWERVMQIEKLIFRDDAVHSESGLVIENSIGDKIEIVSSSFPNAIEILSSVYSDGFEPECDLDVYVREYLGNQ